ncbi:hypothetical protein BaRGS_00003007 [Batillaria attramentaria]|uniref:Uncharacterized protein n=1 Tax=Batillaria attramentaria TaxID=370345 RepID=A0ABD0M1X8_9CAEN
MWESLTGMRLTGMRLTGMRPCGTSLTGTRLTRSVWVGKSNWDASTLAKKNWGASDWERLGETALTGMRLTGSD